MKRLLKILAVLLLVLVLAIVALLLFFDPNMLKPRIESAAREQGIALNIDGNLGWQLWPSLGVEINGVRVASLETPDQPIARLESASLLLALRPLFRGEVEVHHIIIDGAAADLRVDSEGRGNWEFLTETAAETEPDAPPATTPPTRPETPPVDAAEDEGADELLLNVARISVRNSSLDYRDARSGQHFSLSDLNLELTDFNLQGDPFDLRLSWRVRIDDDGQVLVLAGDLRQPVHLSADQNRLNLPDGRLALTLGEGRQSVELRTRYSVEVNDLQGDMTYSGRFSLADFSPRALLVALGEEAPVTAEDYALTRLSVEAGFRGSDQSFRLDDLRLQLDRTLLQGDLAVTDFETAALVVNLRGDSINVDDYLPPPPPETDEPLPEPEATGDEILIPVEAVQALNLNASIDFERVIVAGMVLDDIRLRLRAADGLVRLERAEAVAYQGRLNAEGSLDARGDTARIEFTGKVDSLQLAPLMQDMELDENLQFTGAINADAKGSTRGVTYNQLMGALAAEAQFTGVQVRAAPLNIEQQFCELVNLISRVDGAERDWPGYTEMRQLDGKVTVADQVINLETFSAGVEQLALNVRGKLNMATGGYDFTLPLRLKSESTSDDGCTVRSNYWIDRSLSLLRCRGSLDTLNPLRDCRPDSRGMESLAKDFAEYRLRQQHGDRIDAAEQRVEQETEQLRQRLQERLESEDDAKKVEDRLRGLLRGR